MHDVSVHGEGVTPRLVTLVEAMPLVVPGKTWSIYSM